jgi:CHAT domain/Tetratricopeptide Repeats-Sensor
MPSAEAARASENAGGPRLQVRVVHGNLAFTRFPVAVGHYSGDTIVSAEKHLDRALSDALSHRLHLGLYPGPIETSAVFTNPRRATDPYARPGGAIVVGLGTVGTLTASLLTRTFSRALLEFVLERRKAAHAPDRDASGIGVATLLIGTGAGGVSVADSVYALVRGAHQANQALAAARQSESIAELEVIELYEDRAILALESLARLTKPGGEKMFRLLEQLGKRDGGLQRVSYDDEAPEWWQRLQVLGGGRGEDGKGGGLRFTAVTRRARAEVRLLATQRAIVDQFVQDTVETTRHDARVGRTLFDLLLPNDLKESAPNEDNVVLLLDEEAARYPWELLEDSQDRSGRPFVIDRGLLRQLESIEFRSVVRGSAELTALVIADPISSYVELTGAQNEGKAVSEALEPLFTSVTSRIRATSQDVISALFEQPFKVLHLAAHGVYRYALPSERRCDQCGSELPTDPQPGAKPAQTVTGMVIGDGVFLTPGDVAQMRSVPDLVFINCCHLGNTDPGQGTATPQERAFPRLAANLATEFIRMGVRAVIAAGWAVEDGPATTFARTFYRRMLDGQAFGEAVKGARQKTFDQHPASNTWGAYQCYGDPDFRLILGAQRAVQPYTPTFLSPAHALRDLGNIAARLKTHSSDRREEETARLEEIVKALDAKGWLASGAIAAALGRAYGEAGELQRAVDYYCSALGSEDGAVTARDVEQCANLLGRRAVQEWSGNESDPEVTNKAIGDIRRAIYVLKSVLGGRHGERLTSERLALIGSAYKRLAWLDRDGRAEALERMAFYYRKGVERARERHVDSAYPLLNVRWAEVAMQWQGLSGETDLLSSLAADLEAAREEIDAKEQADGPQFWQDSLRVDCELLETLHSGTLSAGRVGELAGQYASRREYASAREFASVCDHLGFLTAMSEPIPVLASLLRELRRQVGANGASPAQP